ncbi:MAG: fumarate hydratase [Eggerthellaceae bacterium]|nr:fumarate hydratase [Eggerthellaceae bacterium]
MTRVITKEQVTAKLLEALPQLAFELPEDIERGLKAAYGREESPRAAEALGLLVENARIAREDRVAICQDTGSVWVCLEIGPDTSISGDVLDGVNEAVADAYTANNLRKSLVRDALVDRANTNDNTPAFAEIHTCPSPGARLHVMCKGGGSDNASRVVMLTPGAGRQGVVDAVLSCVREKAANACPPLVIGIGIGATFDKVAGLAKMALMRPLGEAAPNPEVAAFEAELLEAVNALGIGAAALGGSTTALGVHVNTAPCHIAALPLAINMGCSAMRRGTYEL